jgi:hypothetical protein
VRHIAIDTIAELGGGKGKRKAVLLAWVDDCLKTGMTILDSQVPMITLTVSNPSGRTKRERRALHVTCDMALRGSDLVRIVLTRLELDTAAQFVRLATNSQKIPPDMTLATARTFLWRSTDEMRVEFSIDDSTMEKAKESTS